MLDDWHAAGMFPGRAEELEEAIRREFGYSGKLKIHYLNMSIADRVKFVTWREKYKAEVHSWHLP